MGIKGVHVALRALLLSLAGSAWASLGDPDGVYEDLTLTRIAFGSCSKQYKNQTLWEPIMAFKPQAFLWMGDVIYVHDETGATLRSAYKRQLGQPGYQRLIKSGVVIDGVYDDHDYGVNDGNRKHYMKDRQDAYLDFLGHVDADSPRRSRVGLYSSHVFGAPPQQVKVIFLDLRSLSDPPAVVLPFECFGAPWPLKPGILALTRWISVMLGLMRGYDGDLLGPQQWEWLEAQLRDSQASVHIIVSSIQVLSTNPIVEGWGHFPKSQARLLALLRKYQPRGLILLSGDVHFSELLTTQPTAAAGSEGLREALELTTSGMTHTCFATTWGLCELAVHRFQRHRVSPGSFYGGFNFGTMEVDWEKGEYVARVRNRRGEKVLELTRKFGDSATPLAVGEAYDMAENNDVYMFAAAAAAALVVLGPPLAWVFMALTRRRKAKRA